MPNQKKARESCLSCGTETKRFGYKYCDSICLNNHRYKLYVTSWLAGEESGIKKYGCVSNHVKRYLLEKYGEKCSLCGWCQINPHTHKIPVEVDHIDGDWQNNSILNLRLLCPNCHSLTATYRGRNKGKGRNWRRELYAMPCPK